MNQIEVELGNKTYTVKELPTRKNEAWREGLEGILDPLIGVLAGVADIEVDAANLGELIPSAKVVAQVAMKSPETVRDLVLSYSPALESDRDRLLDEAYDSEFVGAFTQIIGLAYPFGGMVQAVRRISAAGS